MRVLLITSLMLGHHALSSAHAGAALHTHAADAGGLVWVALITGALWWLRSQR